MASVNNTANGLVSSPVEGLTLKAGAGCGCIAGVVVGNWIQDKIEAKMASQCRSVHP